MMCGFSQIRPLEHRNVGTSSPIAYVFHFQTLSKFGCLRDAIQHAERAEGELFW